MQKQDFDMKNTMVTRAIFLGFLGVIFTTFGINAQVTSPSKLGPSMTVPSLKVVLAALSNGSEKPVTVFADTDANKQRMQTVAPFQEKELKNAQIPFIPVRQQDRDAFVGSDPYAPQGSLVVKTKQGDFCIWEDERGVQGAFRFNPEDPAACPREICASKKLFNSTIIRAAIVAGHVSTQNNLVRLRLFVNSLGHVERAENV